MQPCPKCGTKHRTASGARSCDTEVRNTYTFWVITKQAGDGTIAPARQADYEEDKTLYEAMCTYMSQFEGVR